VPVHDDQRHFEFILLDGFQAGLSWVTILRKRPNFRKAFDGFDPTKIARYTKRRLMKLMGDAGIIRNRMKIEASVSNARAFLAIQNAVGSFDQFIWEFVGGNPKQNRRRSPRAVPPRTKESDAMSRALRERGFRFVGSTICYAYMQAAGMVNDHEVRCFRHAELGGMRVS
jgi:DNA-3-methyladenine glycosylase I